MAADRSKIQEALQKSYNRILFGKEVLSPVFSSNFSLNTVPLEAIVKPNRSESAVIDRVLIYGNIELEDGTDVICYEIRLQPNKAIEQNKVAIQRYVRKLLTVGQAALVNFISPSNLDTWRLTFIAKDSVITEEGVKERITHGKRYTFLLGTSESCKTAAARFEILSTETLITLQSLVNAFSVEKLSIAFFNEYKQHYLKFCNYLQDSAYRRSVFNISFSTNATQQEKDKASKIIRDFTKKLLGRIVFLYFVQKKGWLGASTVDYKDGMPDFIMKLFKTSGGNKAFYNNWLSVLFFDTLNKDRPNDDFTMPDGKKVKIPFLNGGLFDKEEYDEQLLTFPATLFHNADDPEEPNNRGFFDFLEAFNFTVHEDSPDDQTVAVDPEMLGHIFENLLEDNKGKGTYYTPKEIVHYMCQESLIDYLTTHLSKEYTVYRQLSKEQVELFGNEARTGQLKMIEELGERALSRDDVEYIVKYKDISKLTRDQLLRKGQLLDAVKICDPAIGSGAFPMGLLQEIYAIKEVVAYETNKEWKPALVKENIIQKSVYGVDIEKGAVDIARLRFWLSLIVDENKPRPLPNLDYKIVVGDSLVSKVKINNNEEIVEIDWELKEGTQSNIFGNENVLKRRKLLESISYKQAEYFHPQTTDKKKLAIEIRNLKIDILINQLELMVNTKGLEKAPTVSSKNFKAQTELYLQTSKWKKLIKDLNSLKADAKKPFIHFDWKLDFPDVLNPYLVNGNGGFDIVIGNPPYIKVQSIEKNLTQYFKDRFRSATGKYDIYVIFIEQSFKLLKREGNIAFINPHRFLIAEYGRGLRDLLIEKRAINKLIYFGVKQIFETATTYTGLFFMKKDCEKFFYAIPNDKNLEQIEYFSRDYFSPNFSFSIEDDSDNILSTILSHKKVSEIFEGVYQGLIPMGDDIQVLGGKIIKDYFEGYSKGLSADVRIEAQLMKPLLKGENIQRYSPPGTDLFIFYPYYTDKKGKTVPYKEIELKNKFPLAYKYISNFKAELKEKKAKYKTNPEYWYSLHRSREQFIFENRKIITPQLQNHPSFTFDDNSFYADAGGYIILENLSDKIDIRSYLAIFNSKLFYYFIRKTSTPYNNNYYYFKTNYIEPFGIPKAIGNCHIPLLRLVQYILFLRTLNVDKVEDEFIPVYFEQIIDGIVYELYFPILLETNNREIIKHLGELPELTEDMNGKKKMGVIEAVFNRLNHKDHPVRNNLFYMDSIHEIRIIEGKNEDN